MILALAISAAFHTPLPPPVWRADITQANIVETICAPGWAKTQRPPAAYAAKIKRHQLHGRPAKAWTLDHVGSIDLGGDGWAPANLALQPKKEAKSKDRDENRLHALVCGGRMSLRDAQADLARRWP
jgi:hypothetical protein